MEPNSAAAAMLSYNNTSSSSLLCPDFYLLVAIIEIDINTEVYCVRCMKVISYFAALKERWWKHKNTKKT